jgi:hypothetical protein
VAAQLRIYTVKPGAMEDWVDEWRQQVAPLRRRFGFTILGPWIIEAEDRFVWILGSTGPRAGKRLTRPTTPPRSVWRSPPSPRGIWLPPTSGH